MKILYTFKSTSNMFINLKESWSFLQNQQKFLQNWIIHPRDTNMEFSSKYHLKFLQHKWFFSAAYSSKRALFIIFFKKNHIQGKPSSTKWIIIMVQHHDKQHGFSSSTSPHQFLLQQNGLSWIIFNFFFFNRKHSLTTVFFMFFLQHHGFLCLHNFLHQQKTLIISSVLHVILLQNGISPSSSPS